MHFRLDQRADRRVRLAAIAHEPPAFCFRKRSGVRDVE
jgi:hypothetical protein